jgi:two-component system phosphate regulon response regulator PhoB
MDPASDRQDSPRENPMTKKVLVIEDESDIATYLLAVLEDQGLSAQTLKDDAPLAEEAASLRPDLILLDVMMPKRSGVSIYKELRTTPELRQIPVIIISGFSPEGESMAGTFRQMISDPSIADPDGFIGKPMHLDHLIAMVRDTLCLNDQHED